MKKRFKKSIANNKKVIENFSYLSVLQVLNMALPLIVYPYLIRVLGKDTYGLVIYAQAIVGYFVVLINFGYNITATKEISIHKKNKEKLNEIMSSVLIIKGSLLFGSIIILAILIILIPEFQDYKALFVLTLWMCIYEFLFPVYYFQGIEEMKYITVITLISRVIFLTLIFILIHSEEDYLYVPIIHGLGALIAGFIAQYIILKQGVKYSLQPLAVIKGYFKKSVVMALAYASNALKANFSIVAVKLLFSFKEVAYFDLALKISRLGTTFLELISVAVFPKMSREKNIQFLKKIIKISLLLAVLFVLVIELFAPFLVELIGGTEMLNATNLLRIIVLFVPIQILGGLLGRNCLIVFGYDKDVLYSMAISSLIYILLLICGYFLLNNLTISIVGLIFVISFFVDTLYRYIKCRRYNLI